MFAQGSLICEVNFLGAPRSNRASYEAQANLLHVPRSVLLPLAFQNGSKIASIARNERMRAGKLERGFLGGLASKKVTFCGGEKGGNRNRKGLRTEGRSIPFKRGFRLDRPRPRHLRRICPDSNRRKMNSGGHSGGQIEVRKAGTKTGDREKENLRSLAEPT